MIKVLRNKRIGWLGAFLLTLLIVAFGQPDRAPIFGFFAYFFGYSGAFFLLLALSSKTSRFFAAFLWFTCVQLYQLSWLATTHYHGFPIILLYLGIVLLFALQFAFLALLFSQQQQLEIRRALAIAAAWTLIEWSRLYYLCGFPFNPVGLAMTFSLYPLQWASLFGVYGLSFWVFFTAVVGAIAWRRGSVAYLAGWLSLLVLPICFGFVQLQIHSEGSGAARELSVVLVQTGLKEEEKWVFPKKEDKHIPPIEQWSRIFQYLQSFRGKKIDLIVLPEVAVPGDAYAYDIPFHLVEQVLRKKEIPPLAPPLASRDSANEWFVNNAYMTQALANMYGSEVVIGLMDRCIDQKKHYNSAFHFIPFRQHITRYDKRVLVPLSEYMPFSFFRSFVAKYGINTFFTHGQEANLFHGVVPLSASVCYEEGYNDLIREGRLRGAQIFINISNDGWFPFSRLSKEHFNLGRLRAVENGIPLLRAGNTGITSAIDSFGRILCVMEEVSLEGEFVRGAITAKVPLYSWMSPYARFGNLLLISISLMLLLLFILSRLFYKQVAQK